MRAMEGRMEKRRMAQQSKREYLESIYRRYRRSGWAEKQKILDEFMRVCAITANMPLGC